MILRHNNDGKPNVYRLINKHAELWFQYFEDEDFIWPEGIFDDDAESEEEEIELVDTDGNASVQTECSGYESEEKIGSAAFDSDWDKKSALNIVEI